MRSFPLFFLSLLLSFFSVTAFLPSSPSSLITPFRPCSRLYLSSNDIKNGMNIEVDGAPMRVLEFLHVKPGKGAAFVRSKLKNLLTGGNVDKTFRAGEPLDAADVIKAEFQYSYSDGDNHYVMDMESFEVEGVPLKVVTNAEFLVEGMMVNVIKWNNKAIDVELPGNYNFVVEYTEDGEKGNTAQGGGSKPATLDCGATVMVPLFIKQGETVKVDLKEKKYLSRVN